jgi:hypothetical protein
MGRDSSVVYNTNGDLEFAEVYFEGTCRDDLIQQAIDWIWELGIPATDKFDLETGLWEQYSANNLPFSDDNTELCLLMERHDASN